MSKINRSILTLILIIALGIFLRAYKISEYPVQLNHDEVSQLYDAISIAQTGMDIYGDFLPTVFESVHDFKSPFYTYSTAFFYYIFGNHEYTIRITSLLFGILIIPTIFLFVCKLTKNQYIGLTASFFTSISPFEIFYSRKSFENGAGLFFMILGFYFLLMFVNQINKKKFLYLSLVMLCFGMYTYFSHAIIIPLVSLAFVVIYRIKFKFLLGTYLVPLLLGSLLLLPLISVVLLNPGSRYRSETVVITQDRELGKQINEELVGILPNLLIKYKVILEYSFNRYLNQFNVEYIFGDGLDLTNQGLLGMGLLYLVQIPLGILGIVHIIKLKGFAEEKKFILAWILIGTLPSGLTFESFSPHRSIMVFTMLNIISSAGFYYLIKFIKTSKNINQMMKYVIYGSMSTVFVLNIAYFLHVYFVNFPYEKSQNIHYPFKQIAEFAWSEHDNFSQIVFDPLFGETSPVIGTAAHYYIAYYGNYPPKKFQSEYRLGNKDREILFDKFSIRKVDWLKDKSMKKTLIIASPWSLPVDTIDKKLILKKFYFYDNTIAFYAVTLN